MIYSQGHDMIGKGHVAFQSILIVGLNTSIIYGVFIALAGLYQKLLPKKLLMTFRGLKLPWRHGEGSLVAIFRLTFKLSAIDIRNGTYETYISEF